MDASDTRLKRNALGFLEIAAKPTPDQLRDYYAGKYYQGEKGNYRKSYPADEVRYFKLKIAQRAALAASLRDTTAPGSMLDVGCGEGFALAWFAANGWHVEGLDFSDAGLSAMNPAMREHVECGDVFDLLQRRIESGRKFDLVWLTNVLEHVLQPVELLKSLRDLVFPGGMLIATVPNDGSAYHDSLLENGFVSNPFWVATPDHLAYFTRESMERTAAATGWNCREIIADFPIDWFLLHEGSNYVRDRTRGPAAHAARIHMELLLGRLSHDVVNAFYESMARVGLGRSLTAFLSPH